MPTTGFRPTLLLATAVATALSCAPARAEDSDAKLTALEHQIQAMQAELRALKHEVAAHNQAVKEAVAQAAHARAEADSRAVLSPPPIPAGFALVPAGPGAAPGSVVLAQVLPPEPPAPKLPLGTFQVGGVRVTLGGFVEAAGIYRSRNEVSDIASNFNTGIPLPNSPLYHENQTSLSTRQTRFATLAQGNPDDVTTLTAFFEGDLQASPPTGNSVESGGYSPRLRHAIAVYDRSDLGFYVLGGQTWSLLTMNKSGIPYLGTGATTPAATPPGIDGQYVVGFNWTRNVQLRAVKSFDNDLFWLAASIENPQTSYYAGPNGAAPGAIGTINDSNPGGSGFYSGTNYSTEVAPDVIVKAATDPWFGHFEVYGLARFEHDRVSQAEGFIAKGSPATGDSHTANAGGIGAAMFVPLVPKYLELQASVLTGKGIGRYGSAQLPDAVIGANGKPEPLSETEAMIGLIGHPIPAIDIYGFGGAEEIRRHYYDADVKGKDVAYGYGNPLYPNTTCNEELGATATCTANTSGIVEGTIGAWWKFEHGTYGTMQVGPQYSYIHRTVFQGAGPTPKTDENTLMLSFRYYPFQ
jgi:hypothetical protein